VDLVHQPERTFKRISTNSNPNLNPIASNPYNSTAQQPFRENEGRHFLGKCPDIVHSNEIADPSLRYNVKAT